MVAWPSLTISWNLTGGGLFASTAVEGKRLCGPGGGGVVRTGSDMRVEVVEREGLA